MTEESPEYKLEKSAAMTCHMTQDSLKELIEIAVERETKPQLNDLFGALATAQGQIKSAIADKENTHFNFKYADLDACWEACRVPLSENELAIIQLPEVGENNAVTMVTILGHSSGQSISSTYTMYPDKTTPQGIASCMTYLRRYMLCAMVGISQEDDDANRASADPDEYVRISKVQADEILVLADNLFKKSADAVVDRMLAKVFELTSVKDIPADLFEQAKTLLQNQANREKPAPKADPKPKPKPKAKTDKQKLAELDEKAGPDIGDGPDNEVPGT